MVLSCRASNVSTVWVPLYWSWVCIVGLRCLLSLSLPMPTPALCPTLTSPNLKNVTSACNRACPFPACVAYGGGDSCVGSGPALEHQNRPHSSGGGDIISRPYAFRVLKNTRIA